MELTMTKGIALLLAAASAVALAVPAHAQEDRSFSGPWVAGVGGYDKTQAGSTVDDDVNEDNDQSAEGLVWGGAAGYDVDLGTMVIGGEVEFTESTADTNSLDGDPEGDRKSTRLNSSHGYISYAVFCLKKKKKKETDKQMI